MSLRQTFNRAQSTTSVVLLETLWSGAFLVFGVLSGQVVTAAETCMDLLLGGDQAIDLDTCRPAPIGADEKSVVLKSLPKGVYDAFGQRAADEVTRLSESEQQKLRALNAVLHLHHRLGVYEIKVISVPQAGTALYARAVLLISLPALDLLDSEELQALVAHEIGHEYVWEEFALAQLHKNRKRLRELELVCDTIAVLTLERIGVKPDRLIVGLEKACRYNCERFGLAVNGSSHPSFTARQHLVKAMSSSNRQRLRELTGRSAEKSYLVLRENYRYRSPL